MGFDLDGNGSPAGDNGVYATAFPDPMSGMGCASTCIGYELTADLKFDTNGNLIADVGDDYWNDGVGWVSIPAPEPGGFDAVFEGNGHTISNLYINWTGGQVGLFGKITDNAEIRNVGLVNVDVTGGVDTGALVGFAQEIGGGLPPMISASYATGRVSGGNRTGGLVGSNQGIIIATWADVAVSSSGAHAGGLVGHNANEITASYALGTVNDVQGGGRLVGTDAGTVTDSYSLIPGADRAANTDQGKIGADLRGTLGYTGIYAHWNVDVDGDGTPDDPWDFRTATEYPALKADRNSDGVKTWQEAGAQERAGKTDMTLRQSAHPLQHAAGGHRQQAAAQDTEATVDYDADDDNLIDVATLAQLNAIRWDNDGGGWTGGDFPEYLAAFPDALSGMGCPNGCKGYELVADLDFDTNGNGHGDFSDFYGGSGWTPIGGDSDEYTAEFHGNGHTISNMFIDTERNHLGLFGKISGSSFVHHVGMVNVNLYGDSGSNHVGALVGEVASNQAAVAASYATGQALGAQGSDNWSGSEYVGGLVGTNHGYVVASWTDMRVTGHHDVGGVVGENYGAVLSLYALGTVESHHGFGDRAGIHGVVGWTHYQTNLKSVGVYYNWDSLQVSHSPYSKTTGELKGPTGYTGIYDSWNIDTDRVSGGDDPWDFGAADELPALKADRNGDGTATWQEFGNQRRGGTDYDTDNDNLIEVSSMEQLNAIRFDMEANGLPENANFYDGIVQYRKAFPNYAYGMGCPNTCRGYELTADLNHDTNGNGRFDKDDWPYDDGAGWRPIGFADDGVYTGEFDGNGHSISNLYIDRDGNQVGLFGKIGGNAYVHHVGLPNARVVALGYDVGTLVGWMQGSGTRVSNSYATGVLAGGGQSGGLVGSAQGEVRAVWTDVVVRGYKHVGGLVGHNGGFVTAGYALNTVSGEERVHGVIGLTAGGRGLTNVYYNSDIHTVIDPPYSRTEAELQNPTGYTGIYADWNVDVDGDGQPDDPWTFGANDEYPLLKGNSDSDGTVQEFSDQRDQPVHDRAPVPVIRFVRVTDVPRFTVVNDLYPSGVDVPDGGTVPGGSQIQVFWSASDPEGRLHSYRLRRTDDGPGLIGLYKRQGGNWRPEHYHWDAYVPDVTETTTFVFEVTATDRNDAGEPAQSAATVAELVVVPMNPLPVITYTDNPVEGQPVVLDGSQSRSGFSVHPGHRAPGLKTWRPITNWQWEQTLGPAVELSCARPGGTRCWRNGYVHFIAPYVDVDTALGFELTVTDNRGRTATSEVQMVIRDTVRNRGSRTTTGPTANAGPPLTGAPGETVTLQGIGSDNPYGEWHQMEHQWTQLSGTTVTLTHPHTARYNQSADKFGDPRFVIPSHAASGTMFEFKLTVTDQEGASDSDTTTVTVRTANTPPVVAELATVKRYSGETVTLTGSATDAEDDGAGLSLSYRWAQTGGTPSVTMTGQDSQTMSFTAPPANGKIELTFQLTVGDSGDLTASRDVTVTVQPKPTACAGPDLSGAPGGTITLQGKCSTNPYGAWWRMRHQWTQTSGQNVTLTHPNAARYNQGADRFGDPRFVIPSNAAPGTTFTFELTVTDKEGGTDTDTMTVTVT